MSQTETWAKFPLDLEERFNECFERYDDENRSTIRSYLVWASGTTVMDALKMITEPTPDARNIPLRRLFDQNFFRPDWSLLEDAVKFVDATQIDPTLYGALSEGVAASELNLVRPVAQPSAKADTQTL